MRSRVSVIVPCYNGEKFIDRCMSSLNIQDYENIEIIVVDDGSKDDSKSVILKWKKEFIEKGIELKYIYQENQGPGGAINTGLKYVSGDYISLLDIDDEYLPRAILEKASFLDEHPEVDIVRSNGYIVSGDTKYLFEYSHNQEMERNLFLELIKDTTYNWAGSYMVRAKALFAFYPDREIYTSRYGQNLQFLMPLSYKKEVGFIGKPHMNYIRQPNSLSRTQDVAESKNKSIANAKGYTEIRRYLIELIVKDKEERKEYLRLMEGGYLRAMMEIATEYNDKELMKDSASQLKQIGLDTINDRIVNYSLTRPIFALVLRFFRKVFIRNISNV